jgi:hypothetical protein
MTPFRKVGCEQIVDSLRCSAKEYTLSKLPTRIFSYDVTRSWNVFKALWLPKGRFP